jgi:hypothetical protein
MPKQNLILECSAYARDWFKPILTSERLPVLLLCALLLWILPYKWLFKISVEEVKQLRKARLL